MAINARGQDAGMHHHDRTARFSYPEKSLPHATDRLSEVWCLANCVGGIDSHGERRQGDGLGLWFGTWHQAL